MPNLGELAAQLIRFLSNAVESSSMRLGPAPTVAILGVLLVLLSLLARPTARWSGADLGRLAEVGRAMALAAESGADATLSLGGAGVVRAASALDRFQTLGALPLLGYVAEAAARAGVPLHVTTNDPVAVILVQGTLAGAHQRTATLERASTSSVEYLGEGRAVAAAAALAGARPHGVAIATGALAEEGLLLLDGVLGQSDWRVAGTASASQVAGPLMNGDGTLIGPQLFQAASETSSSRSSSRYVRASVLAANRLIWSVIAVLLLGSIAAWAGGPRVVEFLAGR